MSSAADSADALPAPKAARALAFATSFVICLMAAGALVITLLGQSHGPIATLDLGEHAAQAEHGAAHASAAGHAPSAAEVPAGPAPITKPIFAGTILLTHP